MINLIVGAAISLFSSLVVLFITNYFQSKRDERDREWHLIDKKDEKLNQIYLHRIDELETYAKEISDLLSQITTELPSKTLQGDINYLDAVRNNLISIVTHCQHYGAVSIYLGGDIDKLFLELNKKVLDTGDLINSLRNKILKNEQVNLEIGQIMQITGAIEIYSKLLKSIDRLKCQPPDQKLITIEH